MSSYSVLAIRFRPKGERARACSGVGPRRTLSPASSSSTRPPQKPRAGPPIDSIATVPASVKRSPHESAEPYLSLRGPSSARALSCEAKMQQQTPL
eukprot:4917220-Pleurochrysis_carterae.AAC.1